MVVTRLARQFVLKSLYFWEELWNRYIKQDLESTYAEAIIPLEPVI